jgi:hypothetical protein
MTTMMTMMGNRCAIRPSLTTTKTMASSLLKLASFLLFQVTMASAAAVVVVVLRTMVTVILRISSLFDHGLATARDDDAVSSSLGVTVVMQAIQPPLLLLMALEMTTCSLEK